MRDSAGALDPDRRKPDGLVSDVVDKATYGAAGATRAQSMPGITYMRVVQDVCLNIAGVVDQVGVADCAIGDVVMGRCSS